MKHIREYKLYEEVDVDEETYLNLGIDILF